MDVRPGGAWRATMFAGPERVEIRWTGEYREVVEPERLVFTVTDRPEGREYELVTVVLTDLGDGRTQMDFAQTGGHLTADEYERAGQGWSSFFDVWLSASASAEPRRALGRALAVDRLDRARPKVRERQLVVVALLDLDVGHRRHPAEELHARREVADPTARGSPRR